MRNPYGLQGILVRCEASEKVMVCAHSKINHPSEQPAADWSPWVGQCLHIQSTWTKNRLVEQVIAADWLVLPFSMSACLDERIITQSLAKRRISTEMSASVSRSSSPIRVWKCAWFHLRICIIGFTVRFTVISSSKRPKTVKIGQGCSSMG